MVDRCKLLLEYRKTKTGERWDHVIRVLQEVDLNASAAELEKALASLKEHNSSRQRVLDHTTKARLQNFQKIHLWE